MSKIQVDAIEQQTACGTTLTAGGGAGKTVVVDATTVTLGRCGGTVALASGASQTGFGRTGTVNWITTPKTATFTAVSGEGYFCNTSGGAFTVNLPAGVAGAIVSLADYAATFQTNNVTVTPNGTDKIGSQNQNATLNVEGQSVTFVFVDSTQGWINTMDSTSNVRGTVPFMVASVTGACNTLVTAVCCANTKIATFTGPGNFCVSAVAGCTSLNAISYMVIAGGGSGGSAGGAGGGAGGFREGKTPITPYTASPLNAPAGLTIASAAAFPVVVGGGGTGSPNVGGSGSNSTFSTIISTGGGGGGSRGGGAPGSVPSPRAGLPGGSGGGGGGTCGPNPNPAGGTGNTPPVSPPQGQNGGLGRNSGNHQGGGGGGAGAAGTPGDCAPDTGGPGGNGVASFISGESGSTPPSSVTRAGGGGGGNQGPTAGTGGTGGGGPGGIPSGGQTAGTANTGGGGGGEGFTPTTGAAGGSGIVIIRYKFQ